MPLSRVKHCLDAIALYKNEHPEYQGYMRIERAVFLHVMGEPLLHPDICEIVRHGRSLGLLLNLVTKGTLLSRAMWESLAASGLRLMTVSLNRIGRIEGAISETDLTRQMDALNDFGRFWAGGRDRRLELQYLYQPGGQEPYDDLLNNAEDALLVYRKWKERIADWGFTHAAALPWSPRPEDSIRRFCVNAARQMECRTELCPGALLLLKTVCGFPLVAESGENEAEPGTCPLGCPFTLLSIFSDGETSMCSLDFDNRTRLGSLYEGSVEEIWNSLRARTIRSNMKEGRLTEAICRACPIRLRFAEGDENGGGAVRTLAETARRENTHE